MYVISSAVRDFVHDIKFSTNNQCNADQTFVRSTLVWPLQSAVFGCTHQKGLRLGQCLDIDEMTSSSKVGEFT